MFAKFQSILRTSGDTKGTEYTGKTFADFCIQKGIKREFTALYSPHQSGVCERRWRTTV